MNLTWKLEVSIELIKRFLIWPYKFYIRTYINFGIITLCLCGSDNTIKKYTLPRSGPGMDFLIKVLSRLYSFHIQTVWSPG